MSNYNDIEDNEIRIIGNASQPSPTPHKRFWQRWWFWAAIAAVILLFVLLIGLAYKSDILHFGNTTEPTAEESDFDQYTSTNVNAVSPTIVAREPATVLISDTVVNDVPLQILTPVNAVPELCLGIPDTTDERIILALQAADIRADNNEIVGAFVLKGELLARGVAKKGFCAILDGTVRLGLAESTPYFEEATNEDGYFFRQYPLVCDGRMVENKPKGKALRHALCELDGQVVVVSSGDEESFHDFAQALADLGVQNAINLVGKDAYGFFHGNDNDFQSWGDLYQEWKSSPYLNFLVWRTPR